MKKSIFAMTLCAALAAFVTNVPPALAAPQKENRQAPAVRPEKPGKAQDSSLSGKVVETMNASGYTYVCLEKNGKKTWVAVPKMQVAVGKEMAFVPGIEMKDFESKSLKRTFDSIIFSGGPVSPVKADDSILPPGHMPIVEPSVGSKAAASAMGKDVKVEKAKGANAYTVGELHEKRAALDQKTVLVKGKVVKVSKQIMGKNWVHLQDGSGDATKGSHNLVVTTSQVPAVGDVVTFKGTVFSDKDFGAGYKYQVIIENATITKP
jgi:hypothetical protein